MVLVGDGWCRRNPIQKTDLRQFLPEVNPATGKSHPNTFPRYMRRAAEIQFGSLAAHLTAKSATCSRSICCRATGGRIYCAASGQFGGVYLAAGLYCAASLRQVAPCRGDDTPAVSLSRARAAPQKPGIIPASFVTQVAVGDVNSVQRATRGLANCWCLDGRAKAYILKRCRWCCAHFSRLTPEVLLTTMSGHHLGSVDCWLCQTIHQIFGGDPAGYPRFLRVEPVLGYLLLRHVCCGLATSGNAGRAPLRTVPWGTQWGQLEWSSAATHASLRVQGRRLGLLNSLSDPLPLVQFRLLRRPACGVLTGAAGIRLLPG